MFLAAASAMGIPLSTQETTADPCKDSSGKRIRYMSGPWAITPPPPRGACLTGLPAPPKDERPRAVCSAVPICRCTLPGRMHGMDLTAAASPDSATSKRQCIPLPAPSPVVFEHGAFGARGLCARQGPGLGVPRNPGRPDRPGQISPECFVPQVRIGAKYQTLLCPLSPRRTRAMCTFCVRGTTEARTGNVWCPLPTQRCLSSLSRPLSPFSVSIVYPCQTNRHDGRHPPWTMVAHVASWERGVCDHGQMAGS
ncbi:hypothetical protein QBC39DRAFT_176527 [Podospora conica]|nr:hypothetical protein QBC39DRAFT_176527 [Schizothecium conicum]